MGDGGGASGSQLASSILVVCRGRWVPGWPYYLAARGSSAVGQGDWDDGMVGCCWAGAWFDSGCMVCVSSWVLVAFFFFFSTRRGTSDPEVVSVLLSGVLVCESR